MSSGADIIYLYITFNACNIMGWIAVTVAIKCLTHWGRVTHICVIEPTIIGSDNGLSPGRRQAIIWTNDGILLTGPWGTNFSEILISIQTFSFKKMHLEMLSAKRRPFCLSLNVLILKHMCIFQCLYNNITPIYSYYSMIEIHIFIQFLACIPAHALVVCVI